MLPSLSSQLILTAMTVCFVSPLTALPKAKKVAHGDVEIESSSHHLKIKASDKAIINYDSFNIGEGQQVTFIQPKSGSVVLNRVQGNEASSLMGQLNANGRVFLINPNGIIIGKTGMINTASFFASTLDIADLDFINDRFKFNLKPGTENSSIVHQGTISCPEGAIGLLAPKIRNEGAILAKAGKVVLASGEKVTLDFSGDDLMSFSVEGEMKDALIEHLGSIDASGGDVYLRMKVADEALKRIVNADHIEVASQMVEENGVIRLVSNSYIAADAISIKGDGKTEIAVQGSLDVSRLSEGQKGGNVEIFGDRLVLEGANILASGDAGGGTVLIGGDYKGAGDMQKSQFTFMDGASSIYADAKTTGDGGRVILWSDGDTVFDGKVFTRGGAESGNGGFVETSGKRELGVTTGFVDALAPFGRAGDWLLDPTTITVNNVGGGTLAQAADCTNTTTPVTILNTLINGAASNVILCATTSITVSNAIAMTTSGVGILFQSNTGALIPIALNAGVSTTSGLIALQGNVTIGAAVTLDSTAGATVNGADIQFSGTINGAQNLTVSAGVGSVLAQGAIGGTTPLHLVTMTGNGGVAVGAITTTSGSAAVSLTSTAGILMSGNINTAAGTGTVTANGSTTLNANVAITTSGSAIALGDTDGFTANTESLTIDTTNGGGSAAGAFVAIGDIGSRNSLTSLSITSGTAGTITLGNVGTATPGITAGLTLNSGAAGTGIFLNGGNYSTSSIQHFIGNVQLVTTAVLTSTGNNIVFNNKIDGSISGAQGLIIQAGAGAATFSGLIGSSTPLAILDVTAAGIININNSGITTSRFQSYNSPVSLGADSTLSTTNSPVTFVSTINGAQNLTVSAGTGSVLAQGAIGGTTPLHLVTMTGNGGVTVGAITTTSGSAAVSLTSATGILMGGNINTAAGTGTVTANGNTTLNANVAITTAASAVNLNGDVDGFTSNTESLTIDTTNGGGSAAGASVAITGDIGSRNALTSLSITSGTAGTITLGNVGTDIPGLISGLVLNSGVAGTGIFLNGGNYNAAGVQHFIGNVQIGITAVLTSIGSNIVFNNKIDGALSGAQGLIIQAGAGAATFSGLIGGSTPLSFLDVTAAGIININNNGITTSSFQSYHSPVSLGADSTLSTTNSPVTFVSTIDGAHNLTVSAGTGSVLAQGAIGGTTPLHLVTMTGNGGVTVGAITTTSGSAAVSLTSTTGILMGGNINTAAGTGTVTVNGSTTLNANVAITTAASAVNLNGDVDDFIANSESLTIDTTNSGGSAAGAFVAILGDVGSRNALSTLSITSGTSGAINLGNVGKATPGIATGGLTLNSGVAGTGIFLNGGHYNTTGGAQHYTGNVQLGITATLTSNNQAITFDNKIDGAAANAQGLTLQGGTGIVTLTGAVGSTNPLKFINVSGSVININNSGITTSSFQNYENPVVVNAATTTFTTTDQWIRFGNALNVTSAGQNITINAGLGQVLTSNIGTTATAIGTLSVTGSSGVSLGSVGSGAALSGTLSASSLGSGIRLTGASYQSQGAQTWTGDVTIGAPSTVFNVTTAAAAFSMTGAVDSTPATPFNLTVTTNAGPISITGDIGTKFPMLAISLTGANTIAIGAVGNAGIAVGAANGMTLSASTSITLNGGIYNTSGAAQSYTGPVILGTGTVPAIASLISTNQAITFSGTSTINAASAGVQGLNVNAGTAAATFGAAIGTTALSELIVNGAGGGTTTFNTGTITTSNDQFYGLPVILGADATFTTTNSPVTFANTINGAHNLTVSAGTGSVLAQGAIGGTAPLHLVTMTGNGGVTVGAITTTSGSAAVSLTSATGILISGNINTAAGTGTVTANGNTTLNANVAITTAASAVNLNGDVDDFTANTESLTIDTTNGGGSAAGASVAITGDIGSRNALTSLSITSGTAGTITLGNVGTTTPGITSGLTLNSGVAGTGIFLNGGNYNTSGGAQHFIGNVQIGTTAVLTSTGNNIVFNNKIDGALSGAQGLILRAGAGAATFTGLVGSSTPLSILDVTAAGNININNGGISTTSTQTYNSNTVLGANTTLTTMAGGSQGAAVTFGSTVNATGVGAQNLTVTAGIGAVNMVGNMGAGTALGALTLTGDAGVRLGGNVFTTATGGQTGNILLTSKGGVLLASTTYTATAGGSFTATGDLTIDANATINTTNAAVLINGNVDGSTAGVFTLTGNTANGNLTINGDVGSRNSLVNLVATVGTGTITLGNIGNSSPGITTGLTLNSGAAGTGIFLNGGNYNTSGGAQHYTGNVQLGISATLTSNNQAITFDNKIDGAAANAEGLTLQAGTGVVTLTGLVGSTNPLYFLNVSGSLANINNNGITTSSFQNYNTPVSLGADSTFTTTNSPVTFTSTINGAHNLTVSAGTGSVLAQGAIGGTAPLHLVTMTGNGGVTVGAITTTSGSAAVSLTSATGILMSGNINTAAGTGTVTANGNTTLNTNVAITTAASAVSLNGDVDGFTSNTESLTIDTTNGGGSAAGASVAIAGDIGSRNALTTLSITSGTSGTITLGNIGTSTPGIATGGLTLNSGVAGTGIFLNGGNYNTTGGAQHYTGNVQLGISATLTSNNQAITFDNKIDGAAANAEGLTLQAGTGVVTLTGLVGSTHQLLSLNVSGSGGINVNNGGITTLNNQLYNNQVLLGANATFTTTNSPVVFASTINGTAGQILTVNVGNGPIVVGGAIGSSGVAIGAITMTGNGGVTLNGIGTGTPGAGAVSVTSKGGLILNNGTYSALSHSYTAPVTLAATTTITSVTGQNVTVMGSIDGDGVATRSLSVITPGAGTSTVTGSIGERFALGTLTMNSNTISVGGIGGAELGVSGTTTLTAAANINFTGSAYFANNPTYTAGSNFNIQSTIPTNFNSLVGDINFVTGTVNLTTVTSSLVITTDNTNVSIPSVAGIVGANGHLLISTGTGAVTVGDAPVSFLDVTLNSGAVTLTGNITGDTINVISGTSISNSGGPWTLTATDTILLDAEGGNVGTVGSPINLAIAAGHSGPIVTVGAGLADAGGGTVFLTGATGDAKVHCLPDNPPAHIFFNGVDIGCTGTTPCPACLPCLPCHPTIVITNNLISFVSISNFQAVGGAVYDPFGFSLASDFFFRQDKAASGNCTTATDCSSGKCIGTTTCDCTYNVYNSLRDLDTKCMANNIYTSKPKRKVSPWLLGFLAAAVALVLHRRFYSMNKKP